MKILLLAPHPFYQERGTPIAVHLLATTLAKRGDHVDLLCYHEGEDCEFPGDVTIHRIPPPPGCSSVRPGFSAKKILCDLWMFPRAMALARKGDYDVVHAVEESVFMARWIKKRLGVPYIFDMDSSMPVQIADKTPFLRWLLPLMRHMEAGAIRGAATVVPVCDALANIAIGAGAKHVEILRDISMVDPAEEQMSAGIKTELGIKGPTYFYLGNLESYQGIDLMLTAFARVAQATSEIDLVVTGGRDEDIATYTAMARDLGVDDRVHFTGPKPLSMMGALFNDADILLSPRTQGENTPMKIYSYLGAGKAIVATRLPTHTQVLTDEIAILTDPTSTSFGDAMLAVANDEELRDRLGKAAQAEALSKYSLPAYEETVQRIYDGLASHQV